MAGLYPDVIIVDRFLASVSATTITERFVAPFDLDVVGMLLYVSTAPGTNDGVTVNVSVVPTSQVTGVPSGAANQSVTNPYNLWTSTNLQQILGTAVTNVTTTCTSTVVTNRPYALNYPLPGPTGTSGYTTAQQTSQTTETPVITPPNSYEYQLGAFTAPDNTYNDLNNVSQAASLVHAGDVLSFVITAAGTGNSVGAAANLSMLLYCNKH